MFLLNDDAKFGNLRWKEAFILARILRSHTLKENIQNYVLLLIGIHS